jgi:hypothetical protein
VLACIKKMLRAPFRMQKGQWFPTALSSTQPV